MGTANTIIGIVVLTPIIFGLWFGVRAIGRGRSQIVKMVLLLGFVWLMVHFRTRIVMAPVELFGATTLTAAIIIIHKKFGLGAASDSLKSRLVLYGFGAILAGLVIAMYGPGSRSEWPRREHPEDLWFSIPGWSIAALGVALLCYRVNLGIRGDPTTKSDEGRK
jgi:hypothetical protein